MNQVNKFDTARQEIVDQLSEPMQKWAQMGFIRGFAGVRTEALPKGKMVLPSAAFNEAAEIALASGGAANEEMELRKQFVLEVDQELRRMQSSAINRHFKYAAIGQAFDIAVALLILTIITGLLMHVGAFEPLALIMIFLLSIKMLFVRISARRLLKITEEAFKAKTTNIRFPWTN